MDIKPPCDVENMDDFVRYYEGTYMETRDGRALQISGTVGKNLLLRDMKFEKDESEGYVLIPWNRMQDSLVFGRPSSALVKIANAVYFMYLPQNRLTGRGFRGDYYRYERLFSGRQYRWTDIGQPEHELAYHVFFPEVTKLDDALAAPGEYILSKMYSVIWSNAVPSLYRRNVYVGYFNKYGELDVMPQYPYVEKAVRRLFNFSGGVKYAGA